MNSKSEQLYALLGGAAVVAGVVLQAVAARQLWVAQVATFTPILLHSAGASLGGAGLLPLSPRSQRSWGLWLFAASVALFIPFLALICALLVLPWVLRRRKKEDLDRFIVTHPPALPLQPLFLRGDDSLRLSEEVLGMVLRNAGDPEKRVRAVLALKRMSQKQATPLLRLALKDPSDDVRLLAYALLDGVDDQMNRRIRQRTEALEKATGDDRFILHKTLAFAHWDLSYLGLATGAIEERSLNVAGEELQAALLQRNDAACWLLLGRVYLAQGALEDSDHALQKALVEGLDDSAVRPYLAEVAFRYSDYPRVHAELACIRPSDRKRGVLEPVARYWLGDT